MIHIEFTEEKPQYYGFTGVHLYEVKSKDINGERRIVINEKANAIDLYKLYHDIVIFLSNQVDPYPEEGNIKTYPVFGNPKHMESIENAMNDKEGYQIIGLLDSDDVIQVGNFLNANKFDKEENVQQYYDSLDDEVKEELQMLLEDRTVGELHGYLEPMVNFFQDCLNNNSEVVILTNG